MAPQPKRFEKVTRQIESGARLRRYVRWFSRLVVCGIFVAGLYFAIVLWSPWPAKVTLRHFLAFPSCSSALAVGLAPAREGEPGYWQRLDRDRDGEACEPWPGRRPDPLVQLLNSFID